MKLIPGSTVVRIGAKPLLVKGTNRLHKEMSLHKVMDKDNC